MPTDFDANALAIEYGRAFNIDQIKDEPMELYRKRVALRLRQEEDFLKAVRAHEIYSGMSFDDPNQGEEGPLTGILGLAIQLEEGNAYSQHHENPLAFDSVRGKFARHSKNVHNDRLVKIIRSSFL